MRRHVTKCPCPLRKRDTVCLDSAPRTPPGTPEPLVSRIQLIITMASRGDGTSMEQGLPQQFCTCVAQQSCTPGTARCPSMWLSHWLQLLFRLARYPWIVKQITGRLRGDPGGAEQKLLNSSQRILACERARNMAPCWP